MRWRPSVLDLYEEEATCWGGGAGGGSIASGEDLWDGVGGMAVGGCDEGAGSCCTTIAGEATGGSAGAAVAADCDRGVLK